MIRLKTNNFHKDRIILPNESKPYLISVINTLAISQTVNLFNANVNYSLQNFGNTISGYNAIATNIIVLVRLSVINIALNPPVGTPVNFLSGITGKFYGTGLVSGLPTISVYDLTGLPANGDTFVTGGRAGTATGVNFYPVNNSVLAGQATPSDVISVVGNPTLLPNQTISFTQVSGTYSNDSFIVNLGVGGAFYGFNLVNSAVVTALNSIVISSPLITSSYSRLLAQSQSKPFYVESFLAYLSPAQANQAFLVTYYDSNGRQMTDPIPPIYENPYQYLGNIISYKFPMKIDGNTGIQFVILPSETVTLVIFPKKIADMSNLFSNKEVVQKYTLPDVPIFNHHYAQEVDANVKLFGS